MMKAVICTRYGPPDVLRLQRVERPVPGRGEVLVKMQLPPPQLDAALARASRYLPGSSPV